MAEMRLLSQIEQLAAHLRAELAGGRWEGAMPGRQELSTELRLNERTVGAALCLLERDVSQSGTSSNNEAGIFHPNLANGSTVKSPLHSRI